MIRCAQCGRWWDSEMMICPVCDALLFSNEASSEDADDGIFAEAEEDESLD